ncbi:protein DMR6-LIKE OXYGENASE 2-like isoform X2 [Phoenix dactylifera]|uniref:Protein DMR6-LIKE OXYGENASE 2-like isoform X2 n=1 Tax=Phoenix dactylifera TaxID=42345 RepID=A0A8B8IZJ0_PHODC|nr:protein DMR6-LIKE OXYGENASE 2-like isoform X2 [Phoenix dactylifera]
MMAVPSKLLLADIAQNCSSIPSNFIRPISDRPNLHDVKTSDASIPLIDLQGLTGPGRSKLIKEIGAACLKDGFFQVKNHGIPEAVIDDMLCVSKEFFHLPESERLKKYSDDPMKTCRLSTSFNIKTEKVGSWRDYLRIHCYPLEDFVHEWPDSPPCFRQVVSEYCKSVRELALRVLEAISESLDLERDFMNKVLSSHAQHMAINYYPPCPQPELTYGLPGHKDPNVISLLIQDGVSGLQVLRDGKWVAINPEPYNLVLSNGKYKSVLHRAVVNSNSARISIPTFYCPSSDAVIKPPGSLVDQEHPSIYRSFTYAEYYEKFWDHGMNSESCLDMFKAT